MHASQQLTPCPWKGHYETGHDLRPFGQLLLSPPLWPSMAYAASGRKRRAPLRCAHEILLLQSWALFGWSVPGQPAVFFSHTNPAPASSHQPANNIFLSQRISTSHSPPASWTRRWFHPLQRPVVNNFFFWRETGGARPYWGLWWIMDLGSFFYWILIDGNQKEELYIAKCFP
jgi:hypothetical protein